MASWMLSDRGDWSLALSQHNLDPLPRGCARDSVKQRAKKVGEGFARLRLFVVMLKISLPCRSFLRS